MPRDQIMNRRLLLPSLSLLIIYFGTSVNFVGQAKISPATKQVLTQMDHASSTLKAISADIKQTKVTVIVNDISEKSGKLFFKNHSNKRTLKLEYKHPLKRTLLFEKGRIRILEPTIKRYQEFDTKNVGNSSAFQLFWFGESTKEIQKNYYVTLIREEVIKEKLTSLLELLPKSEKIKLMFSKIKLWIDHQNWIPIKIKLIEASQDHLTTSLTNIKINPKLSEKIFRMKVPPDYDRIEQKLSSSK